jgi:uncharacterized RDD family membrane protein YckC
MECPYCGLINPSEAQVCDCGYNFETRVHGKPINSRVAANAGDMITLPIGVDFVLASLGSRILGQILDGIIALGFALLSFFPIYLMGIGENAFITILPVIYLGYLLFSDGLKGGQSLGKKLVKTAVIDSYNGKPGSYGQSFIRNILQVLSFFDWIFIFGKKRQRLGDKVAGTLVVR